MGKVSEHKIALLITGTLVPNSNYVAHANVEQRRQEYIDALAFYRSQLPAADIYFLENSSYDFQADQGFKQLMEKNRIALLKFPLSDKFSEGKGYQEFSMLDAAFAQLENRYDLFVKLTGRYQVHNIRKLTQRINAGMLADSHKKHRVTQTNVFMVKSDFYRQHIAGSYPQANDSKGRFIEHVVYERLKKEGVFNKVQLFPENPVTTGFSGSYGGTLQRNKYKMMLRNVERKLLRALGFHEFLFEY